ncbi:family 20 glycosylhydrolase [Alistipes sp.]|uniref:family 20 glycosylhydrolase n=1 Tax=Alistipes sp. TaxID=1872444 RepID=UPI0025C1218B|nr:family 20 glycosylhydrolase [Alistipes sp.]
MLRIVTLLCAVLVPWMVAGAGWMKGDSSSDRVEEGVSPGVSLVSMPAQIEESGTRFLLPRTLAMDAKDGIAAARQGNDVIMTPCDCFYLDYYQTPDPEANGEALAIGGCVTLEKCCSFDTAAGLDAEDQHYMKGVQANTWTEFMPDFDHVQHMILPRIAAAAEIGWTPRKSEYVDFRERVRRVCCRSIVCADTGMPVTHSDGCEPEKQENHGFRTIVETL